MNRLITVLRSSWLGMIMGIAGLFMIIIGLLGSSRYTAPLVFAIAGFVIFSFFVVIPGSVRGITKRLVAILVVSFILILGEWLIFASVGSPHGSVRIGSTVRLPLLGAVANYDDDNFIKVKGGFFCDEIKIRYAGSNDLKGMGLNIIGTTVAARVHWGYATQTNRYDVSSGQEMSRSVKSGFDHNPVRIFW